jgi:hydrogenase maturation protease
VKTLILGCGNPDRADDSAGLLVARKLRELGLDAREHSGDMLSLIDEWAGYDEVIIVDAMVSGSPTRATVVLDPRTVEVPREQFHASTHEFGLAEVVGLARSIAQLPPKLTIYGIEAGNCDPGAAVSDEVAQAVETVAAGIFQSSLTNRS